MLKWGGRFFGIAGMFFLVSFVWDTTQNIVFKQQAVRITATVEVLDSAKTKTGINRWMLLSYPQGDSVVRLEYYCLPEAICDQPQCKAAGSRIILSKAAPSDWFPEGRLTFAEQPFCIENYISLLIGIGFSFLGWIFRGFAEWVGV
jgi:phage baseplate assembly protein W